MARGAIKFAALAGLASKARDYARKNPDSVSSTISKVETTVSRKVGPKYAAHVGKGGAAVRSGLGLPATSPSSTTSPVDPDPDTAEPIAQHDFRDPVAPNPAPGTSDDPQPRRRDDDPAPLTPGERPHH